MNSNFVNAAMLHYGTNDVTGQLTAAAVTLDKDTIKVVNKCAPTAAQTITLPLVATMINAGWPPGSRFIFVRDNNAFNTTIIPNAADGFFGLTANLVILQRGLTDTVEFQLPALNGTKWLVTETKHVGRSEVTVDPAGGTTTLTAATIAETVVVTPTVAGGAVVLPNIAALIAAGYPAGFEFTIATNGAQIVTVAPDAADTFLAQASPRSFAATAVAHCIVLRLPAAGPGAWRISSVSPT